MGDPLRALSTTGHIFTYVCMCIYVHMCVCIYVCMYMGEIDIYRDKVWHFVDKGLELCKYFGSKNLILTCKVLAI